MAEKRVSAFKNEGAKYSRATKRKQEDEKRVSLISARKNKGGLKGGVGYIAAQAGLGFLRAGEGVVDAAFVPIDLMTGNLDKAKSRFMDSPVDAMRERLDRQYNPGKGMEFVGKVTGGIGQSVGYGLINAIPYAGTPMMFSSFVEQGISSAAEQTGEVGWNEIAYGATVGALEGFLEMKLGSGVRGLKSLGSSILKKSGKEVVESAAKAGGKSLLKTVALDTAKGAAGEFAEEAISEAVDPLLLRLYNIDENAQFSWENVLYAGVVGGISGGIMSVGPSAINYKSAVSTGRAIQQNGLAGDMLTRAKTTLTALDASVTEAESRIKGKPVGEETESREAKRERLAENRRAKQLSKETRELADKLRKNIAAYESMMADPSKASSDIAAAVLGEMRGNLFLVGFAYEADVIEQVLMGASAEQKQSFVNDINAMLEKQGQKHDYTVADFENNVDDIRRGLVGRLMMDELIGNTEDKTAKGGAEATQTAKEAATSPWDGMADNEDMSGYKAAGEAENALLKAAVNQGVPRGSVQAMLDEYRKGTDMTPAEFAEAWSDGVHKIGRFDLTAKDGEDELFNRLPESAREASRRIGRETAERENAQREAKAKKKKKPAEQAGKKGEVVRGEGLNIQKLSDEQYSAYKAAEVLAEALGTDIVLETNIELNGKTVNGKYNRKTNRFHININAMRNGKNIALYTLGHEVTHYIKEWSPAKFKVLQDFVMKQLGVDAETAIAEKMASLKRLDIITDTMTVAEANDIAAEEVVADGMELILTDGKVLEELAHTDKSLWEKIRDWFFDIIGQIRRSWESLNQASKTAQVLKETVESLDEIERLFTEGAKEAGERARAAEIGEVVQGEGDVIYSLSKSKEQSLKENLRKLGEKRIKKETDSKTITILTDEFTINKNIYSSKGRSSNEINARIKHIPMFDQLIKQSTFGGTDTEIRGVEKEAKKGVVAMHKFVTAVDGYSVEILVRDKGDKQYLYEVKFIKTKKDPQQSMADKSAFPAPEGDVEDGEIIPQTEESVNSKFSISEEISEENSSDNLYSIDEPAENPDVSENRDLTDRELLLAMAEQMVGSEAEYKTVADYKDGYDTIREKQDRIDELTARQRELQSIMFTGEDAKARSDAAKELRSIHEEMNTLLEDVADADRKLTEIEGMKAIRNLIQRERLAVRDTYRTKYKTMYERKTEAKATTEARRSVRRLYNRVNRLLFSPTKTRNVPIGMQSIVAGALQAANVDAEAIERLGQLEEQLAKLEQEPVQDLEKMADLEQRIEAQEQKVGKIKDQVSMLIEIFEATNDTNADGETRLVFDETVLQKLKDLRTEIGNASIRNMDRKQLQALKDFYDMIWHRIKVANNTLASNRKLEINRVGEQSSREVRDSKALKILSPKSMELVGAQTARKYIWSQLKPLTAFEVLGSDTFMSLFREVLNGEDVWARDLEEAFDFIQKTKKKHKYDDWDMIKRQTVETAQGSVDLSLSEIMSLYAYSFREQAKSHLMGGGFVLDPNATARVKGKKLTFVELERRLNNPTRYTLTEKQITELGSYLTDDQRAYVEEVQGYLTGMGEKGNQVSRKLYGIDIFREKHYFPIKVKSEYLESQLGKTGDPKIKNRGMTKEIVPEAKNPLVLQDFKAVAGDHINSMATYHAFVLPVEDLTRVLNFKPTNVKLDADGNPVLDENGMPVADENANVRYDTLKSEIEAKYGAEAVSYIEQLLRDLNGGARRDAAATLMDQGLAAFKRAATMLSLSTIIQQPTSVFRAMAYVDPKWFRGAKKYDYEIVKRYAPVAVMKEIGGFDTGTGMRTTEYLNKKEYKNFNEKLKAAILPESKGGDPAYRAELFGWLTGKADEITWSYLFGACVNEQAAKLKKPASSEEVLKAAGERFADVVRRTQVYDSTLTRNPMMRSKDTGAKLLTQFGAEPATVVSMIVDGLVRSERGDKTFFRKTAAPIAASIIINAMVSSLIYALRDDDEEKNLFEKYLTSLTGEIIEGFNPLEYLPIFRDIMSLFKGYDVERSDMTLIGNLFDQIELITSSNRSVPDKLFGVSGAVASFFGVPITNVYRDVKGIVKTALSFGDAEPMTGGGAAGAVGEGVRGQFNLLYKVLGVQEGNAYELYKAALRGDTAHYDRVAARYETASDAEQALRKELRENDKRINQAAQAKLDGDLDVYESIIEKIEGEGHFDRNLIIRAINNEVMFIQDAAKQATATKEEIEEEEEIDEALYSATDLNAALERGDAEDYRRIFDGLVSDKVAAGKTEAQARSAVKSSITSYWKKRWLAGYQDTETRKRIIQLLTDTGLYGSRNDVALMCEGWVKDAAKKQ